MVMGASPKWSPGGDQDQPTQRDQADSGTAIDTDMDVDMVVNPGEWKKWSNVASVKSLWSWMNDSASVPRSIG